MTRTIVIGDLHGDVRGLIAVLRATGATGEDGQRLPDTRVIQLGDLIHGGQARHEVRAGVNDLDCLVLGLERCDELIIGNHDLPHIYPEANFPNFAGQEPVRKSVRMLLAIARSDGRFTPATHVGDWLLTHAGLEGYLAKVAGAPYSDPRPTAATLVAWIRAKFAERVGPPGLPSSPIFDAIGRKRGGSWSTGGLFWCDQRELEPSPAVPLQIVGHTPQESGPNRRGDIWFVDCGAALSGQVCAIVRDEEGEDWRPVTVTA